MKKLIAFALCIAMLVTCTGIGHATETVSTMDF